MKNIKIKIELEKHTRALTDIKKELSDLSVSLKTAGKETHNFKSNIKSIAGLGAGVFAIGASIKAVTSSLRESITLFGVQEKAEAKLEATLRSTGGAAGFSANELKNYASELQKLTTFGDEATIGMMSVLNTFKSISGEEYKRSIRVIQDISVVLGKDLNSSALQVGKALNDPLSGLSALSESGIQFTQSQKNLVKGFVETNQVAKAQNLILKELESQFGGSAEAAANTMTGALEQLGNKYGDLQEKVGAVALKTLKYSGVLEMVDKVIDSITDSDMNEFLIDIVHTMGFLKDAGTGVKLTLEAIGLAGLAMVRALMEHINYPIKAINAIIDGYNYLGDILGYQKIDLHFDKLISTEGIDATIQELKTSMDKGVDTLLYNSGKKWAEGIEKDIRTNLEKNDDVAKKAAEDLAGKKEKFIKLELKNNKDTNSKKLQLTQKYISEKTSILKEHYERIGDFESLRVQELKEYSKKVNANTKLTEKQKIDIIASFSKKLTEDFTEQSKARKDKAKKEALELQNLQIQTAKKAGEYVKAWETKEAQIREELVGVEEGVAKKRLAVLKAEFFNKAKEEARSTEFAYGKVAGNFADGLIFAHEHLNKLPTKFEQGIEIANSSVQSLQNGFQDFFDAQNKNFLDFGKLGKRVLEDIANKMLKMQVIDPLAKAGGEILDGVVGGIITGIFGLKGYSEGGLTPNLDGVVGVLHKNEYVVPEWQVKKNWALVQALEAERVGKKGFYIGGGATGTGDRDLDGDGYNDQTGKEESSNWDSGGEGKSDYIYNGVSFTKDGLLNEKNKGKSFYEAIKTGDYVQGLKHIGNFIMDAVAAGIGGAVGGSLAGPTGAKIGAALFKSGADYIEEIGFGWKDGDPTKLTDKKASETFEKLSEAIAEQASTIKDGTKGIKNTLDSTSKVLDLASKIAKYESNDEDRTKYKEKITTLHKELEDEQKNLSFAHKKDIISNAKLLWKDIFNIDAPAIKENTTANFEKLFESYIKEGNRALTKTLLDGSLFDTENLYKKWEDYATKEKKQVDEVLQKTIGSIVQTRDDFTKWSLKDNATALAKYNANMTQKQFQTIAKQMGVNFASLTAQNFLTKYNEAISNTFDPQIINNWNSLGNAFKQASDAQVNYTNAVIQTTEKYFNAQISLANALGEDTKKLALEASEAGIKGFLQNLYGETINPFVAKSSADTLLNIFLRERKRNNLDEGYWGWFDFYFNGRIKNNKNAQATFISLLTKHLSLKNMEVNKKNSINTVPAGSTYNPTNLAKYDFYSRITSKDKQIQDAMRDLRLFKVVQTKDRYGRVRRNYQYLKFDELTQDILKARLKELDGHVATTKQIAKVNSALGVLDEAMKNTAEKTYKLDLSDRLIPFATKLQEAKKALNITTLTTDTLNTALKAVNNTTYKSQDALQKMNKHINTLDSVLQKKLSNLVNSLTTVSNSFSSIETTAKSFKDNIFSSSVKYQKANYISYFKSTEQLVAKILKNNYTQKDVTELSDVFSSATTYAQSYLNSKNYENRHQEEFEKTVIAHKIAQIGNIAKKENITIKDVLSELKKLREQNEQQNQQLITIQQQLLETNQQLLLLKKEA